MSGTPQRRIGRPTKAPARGAKRIKLGHVVSAEIKRQLDKAAKDSGLSVSQVVERAIEAALRYETVFGTLNEADDRAREIATGKVQAALRRAGWKSFFEPRYGGDVWAPPGRHPQMKPAVTTPAPVVLQDHEQRLRALEERTIDTVKPETKQEGGK
jgi:post-segregation antitoxin (ccd killing protein)